MQGKDTLSGRDLSRITDKVVDVQPVSKLVPVLKIFRIYHFTITLD